MANENTALVEKTTDINRLARIQELVGSEITTQEQYTSRIRELQDRAHILTPAAAFARLAPSHVINPVVVVIDPSVDAESGRGAEVYHQPAIHKRTKRAGTGERGGGKAVWDPVECSINKNGLLKILGSAGVDVLPSERLDGGATPHLWIIRTQGTILEFDGHRRHLPPGTASVDLRDGSADIGEWTPEEWAKRVAIADQQRAKTPKDDQWKVKPESIGGWTHERVIAARKFGYRLAETKSLNALARNLGIRQVYTIADLAKPFVLFRVSYIPDTSDPEIRKMLTASALGMADVMYGGRRESVGGFALLPASDAISHGAGDPTGTFDVVREPEPAERMATAAPPQDTEELTFDPPPQTSAAPPQETYTVTKAMKRGTGPATQYFAETKEGVVLFTTEADVARALVALAKAGTPREILTERIVVEEKPYRAIVEIVAPQPGLAL